MKKNRAAGRLGALFAVVVLGGAGYGAYKIFFNRAGEAAIQFIPSDASMVVTVDSKPSTDQVETFKRIGDAMQKEGLNQQIDKGLSEMFNKTPIGTEIRPFIEHSYAFAYWGKDAQTKFATFVAVNNPSAVTALLKKYGKPADAPDVYKVEPMPGVETVIGDYVLVASDSATIGEVLAVKNKQRASVASLPEYIEARAALPANSNFMCFMSPDRLSGMFGPLSKSAGSVAKWMAVGAAIEADGLQISYRGPYDTSNSVIATALKGMKPIDAKLLSKLTGGAYGVFEMSSMDKVYESGMAANKKGDGKAVNDAISEFERDSGISIKDDILPGIKGDMAFAVYPGTSSDIEDVDLLLLVDSANEANPAVLADKLRALAERKSAENGRHPVKFEESKLGEATVWSLDAASQHEMSKDMTGPWSKKTILFATYQNSVVVATSRAVLNKALGTMQMSGSSLADDPAFIAMGEKAISGAQSNCFVNLAKVMEALRPNLEKSMGNGSPIAPDDIIAIFGAGNSGLVMSARADTTVGQMSMFIPMDWERVVHAIGAATHPQPPMNTGGMPVPGEAK